MPGKAVIGPEAPVLRDVAFLIYFGSRIYLKEKKSVVLVLQRSSENRQITVWAAVVLAGVSGGVCRG